MLKTRLVCGAAACAVAAMVSAKEFPLTFKTLTVEEAMAFPGGSGAYGSLSVRKPASLRKEPKAISTRPLYGEVARGRDTKGFLFRVDESGGDGNGYDQFLLDLNQNDDLTDDPVAKLADTPKSTKSGTRVREQRRFGPIAVPAAKRIGPGQPIYYAEMNHYPADAASGGTARSAPARGALVVAQYVGQLRLKPGYCLETTVDVGGVKQKLGLVDGNANFHLGDESKPVTYKSSKQETWYFPPTDSFLKDADGSGKFDNNSVNTESSPFGSVLYFGATPYRATLAADCTSLRVEPWPVALAEVSVQPQGDQVREVWLAWERAVGEWVLLKAGVTQGKTRVPYGNLRFTGCLLAGRTANDEQTALGASYRKLDKTIRTWAGQTATLRCGPPLELRVTTQTRKVSQTPSVLTSSLGLMNTTGEPSDMVLQIRAELVGAAGETFAAFAKGKNLAGEPPKPQFAILTKDGKEVAAGSLEFG